MFKPEWHRDGRKSWHHIGSSAKLSPPLDKWKSLGLRFPPGYKEVWVDLNHKKTPVRFLDQEDRIQYQYWANTLKKHRKAHWGRLHQVGPDFYKKLQPILHKKYPQKDESWELNDVIRLMIRCSLECGIRPGYPKYRDAHQSFGISTLEMRHVVAKPGWTNPQTITLRFPGKKQVLNECDACMGGENSQWKRSLLSYINWRRKQGGLSRNSLFWLNPETHEIVHPSLLNDWLQKNVNSEVKMKDLRTWLVHQHVLQELSSIDNKQFQTEKERKQIWKEVIQKVAEQTHHTPAICQSSYLHPQLKEDWLKNYNNFNNINEKTYLLKIWK